MNASQPAPGFGSTDVVTRAEAGGNGHPPAPPAAFPAPALSTWGDGSRPAVPNRRRTGVIVTAVVAVVAVIGGGIAVLGLAQADAEPATDPHVLVPAPEPGAAPPTVPVVTVPGPQPPPEVRASQPEPSPDAPTPEPSPLPSTTSQTVFDRIAIDVPDGWDLVGAEDGMVIVGTAGALFTVVAAPVDVDAETLVSTWVADASADLEAVTATSGEAISPPTDSVVSTFGANYSAVLPTQQGSLPVEAMVVGFVTQDGIGVLVETLNETGELDTFVDDYVAMVDSIIATM